MIGVEARYPGRAPIDSYGNGGFRFAQMSHKGSILCLPSGIYAWERPELDALAAYARVFAESDALSLLLTGKNWKDASETLRKRYERVAKRRGKKIGRLVVGRMLLRSIYKMLRDGVSFCGERPTGAAVAAAPA